MNMEISLVYQQCANLVGQTHVATNRVDKLDSDASDKITVETGASEKGCPKFYILWESSFSFFREFATTTVKFSLLLPLFPNLVKF